LAGIALYEKNGFKIIAERPDYYRSGQGKEDAIVMRLDLAA
jgi:ribosomal protein S18 acetylase RimI-like enzyme